MGAFLGYLSRQSLVVRSLPAPFGVGSCSHRMVLVGRDIRGHQAPTLLPQAGLPTSYERCVTEKLMSLPRLFLEEILLLSTWQDSSYM